MTMTREEGVKRLLKYCDVQMRKTGWFIFKNPNLKYKTTRLLEDYEKTANLPLPEKLKIGSVKIDSKGVGSGDSYEFEWKDICVTGIMTRIIPSKSDYPSEDHEYYLLLCLMNGEIIEFFLQDIDHLHGLLGHFVEQYKLQYAGEKENE